MVGGLAIEGSNHHGVVIFVCGYVDFTLVIEFSFSKLSTAILTNASTIAKTTIWLPVQSPLTKQTIPVVD